MKNLQQIRHQARSVDKACCSCFRQEDVVVASLQNGMVSIEQLSPTRKLLASFDTPELAPGQPDRIVNLQYSEEDNSLCVIMEGGDIIVVQLDLDQTAGLVDIIGSIDQAVTAAEWSPDQDIIAIATAEKISLLTKTFESLAEIALVEEDIKASSNQVSVGWGRAETQFRGKRAPRDPTLPETVDQGTLSSKDRRQTRISWRGDGAYLSLSTIGKDRRVIRVYSREGELESTSEPVNGQNENLSWKPSGSLIVSTQQTSPVSQRCIFFEKNGLRHGEFDLRDADEVRDLKWNSDGSVLALQYNDRIDFWVASNYRYALKSTVPVDSSVDFHWHAECPLRLIITSNQSVLDVEFRWRVITHIPTAPNDFGLLGMVDGSTLGLTPVRLANVPPPMSFRTLCLPGTPRDVAVSDDTKTLAILFPASVQFYNWDLTSKPVRTPQLIQEVNLEIEPGVLPLQILSSGNNSCHILLSKQVVEIDNGVVTTLENSSPERSTILSCPQGDVLLQSGHGTLISIQDRQTFVPNPEFCHTLVVVDLDGEPVSIGLSQSGKLYIKGSTFSTKVTSFIVLGKFLAYTTSNFLKFIYLSGDLIDVDENTFDERCRQIERGSLLVCSCPTAQSITLQAPRGNLETVYPRLLVLAGIRNSISSCRWVDAWRMAKIHRIDTNIMCDHEPELFYSNLRPFISELRTSTELDLFLSGLKAEDVTQTMYENTSLNSSQKKVDVQYSKNKVNEICDRVLSILHSHFGQTHLTSILTAHLSKAPADYEAALRSISELPQGDIEDAIVHVCFLADAHLLYNQALALYDLPLALLLVQKSQKDPREYVPFLQSIQKMPVHRQHFSLDDHLGHYSKALESLLKIEDVWQETVEYIQRHDLWQSALQLLRHDRLRNLAVVALYAEYLNGRLQYSEAGHAFEFVADYTAATQAFEAAGLWLEAVYTASLAGIPQSEVATRMAEKMVDLSRYSDAATIYHEYLHDDDQAIQLHCRAFEFSRAILLAKSIERRDALVKPGLTDAFVQISELLSEMKAQLNSQLPRLRDVREKRDENPDLYYDGVVEDDTPDNISLVGTQASTSASVYTRYTGATVMTTQSKKSGKARRRQERQRAKGKKGTIWEEEYLVNSVKRLVERLEQTRGDARDLLVALVRCDMRENALEIQKSILNLINLAKTNLDEVFSGILTLPEELQRSMGTKPVLNDFEVFELC